MTGELLFNTFYTPYKFQKALKTIKSQREQFWNK